MSFKIVLLCAQALLVQAIYGSCIGAYNGYTEASLPCAEWAAGGRLRAAEASLENAALADGRYGYSLGGFAPATMAASNGGSFTVASSSPISPNGVSLLSENAFEGPLAVAGELPFLGTVGLEGVLPTAGAGSVAYSAGNGNVGILNEDLAGAYAGYAGSFAAGPYGGSLAGPYAGSLAVPYGGSLAGPYAGSLAGPLAPALSPAYGFNSGCGCGRF